MNAPKGFYVIGACALFGSGFGLMLFNISPMTSAGAFIGCGLMGIANAISALSKPGE